MAENGDDNPLPSSKNVEEKEQLKPEGTRNLYPNWEVLAVGHSTWQGQVETDQSQSTTVFSDFMPVFFHSPTSALLHLYATPIISAQPLSPVLCVLMITSLSDKNTLTPHILCQIIFRSPDDFPALIPGLIACCQLCLHWTCVTHLCPSNRTSILILTSCSACPQPFLRHAWASTLLQKGKYRTVCIITSSSLKPLYTPPSQCCCWLHIETCHILWVFCMVMWPSIQAKYMQSRFCKIACTNHFSSIFLALFRLHELK